MLTDMIDRLGTYSNDELSQLSQAIRDELKRRVKDDPVMYVVCRNPHNELEVVRYQTTRSITGVGFGATSRVDYNLVVYESRRWAEFVAKCATKRQIGKATYDVIELPKEIYYKLPCYQKSLVTKLQILCDYPDKTIAKTAKKFLGEIDCFNDNGRDNPRYRIKDWLDKLKK